MPKDFRNGGYVFSPATLIISAVITTYCAKLLLDTNERLNGGSFPEMAYRAYGPKGKLFVEIVLVASQFGFCTAYVYFVGHEIGGPGGVINCISYDGKANDGAKNPCDGGILMNKWIWMPICMAIYVPLVMVRKIEVFAVTHVFADVMIILTVIILMAYAGVDIGEKGT